MEDSISNSQQFHETFKNIKSKHDDVLQVLDAAVRNEEKEEIVLAFENYKKAIVLIDQVLVVPVSLPANVELVRTEWHEACKMIHKLKKIRADALQRIGVLSRKVDLINSEKENSITMPSNETGRPRTYVELARALRNMQCNLCPMNSLELLFSCNDVKLYHIKSDGTVTSTMENSVMRIIRLEKDDQEGFEETFFIQIIPSSKAVSTECLQYGNGATQYMTENSEENKVLLQNYDESINTQYLDKFDAKDDSSWIYPLYPGASPCFRTDYGAFIFPNLESLEQGTSYGVIVPKDNKNDEIVLEILESILHGVITYAKEDKVKVSTEEEISENIVNGAQFISRNLIKGAGKTGKFLSYATPFLISKMKGAQNETPVSENVQTTVKIAKNVTEVAAGATGYIAGKVGSATMALGRFLAPHIERHGSTLLSKGLGLSEQEAQKKVTGVLTIAASAVEGFSTIYLGLEESAKILSKSLGENSVKVIEHRYGSKAGDVAASTFDTVGNMINLSQNVSYFTTKGLAKKTMKSTGKAIIESYHRSEETDRSVYPNLSLLEVEIKK